MQETSVLNVNIIIDRIIKTYNKVWKNVVVEMCGELKTKVNFFSLNLYY